MESRQERTPRDMVVVVVVGVVDGTSTVARARREM
jgi:hypothetical protein